MTKFSVSYARKVQTRPYENLSVYLIEEFDTDEISQDDAFSRVHTTVEKWIEEKLKSMGIDEDR